MVATSRPISLSQLVVPSVSPTRQHGTEPMLFGGWGRGKKALTENQGDEVSEIQTNEKMEPYTMQ